MRKNEGINLLDFDIYSNRISLFSNNRERIGSYFGLFLTIIYIMISIILIVFHLIDTVKRTEMRVYDSTTYSKNTPSINIDSNMINFAFGLEDRISSNRFVEPSIYYPEILYFDRVKLPGGEFQTVERKVLKFSRCSKEHFGKNYMDLLVENELNNSYCLDDFNLTLAGGFKYDRMSYIRIKIIPCVNKTENNFTCKSREEIDYYLTGGYISVLLKDIGLNPSNYSFPVTPTLQDLYTTIDKQMFRDFILNFRIDEIQTDTGLFYENIYKKNYLQFLNYEQSFYFRSEEEYYSGKQVCAIQIRLNDLIHIQRRSYKKLPEIFSIIGGYMQLLSTIFSLISLLISKLDLEVKIMNELFNFNIRENKMTMKIRTLKDFALLKNKDYMKNPYTNKKILFYQKIQNRNSVSKKNLILKSSNALPIINNFSFKNKDNLIENNKNNNNFYMTINNQNNILFTDKKNNDLDNSKSRIKSSNNNPIYFKPLKIPLTQNNNINQYNKSITNENNTIQLNLFSYYCFGRICKKKIHIELFNIGITLYRKRMDIINVFTILLLTEKIVLKIERQKILSLNEETDNLHSSGLKIDQKNIEL